MDERDCSYSSAREDAAGEVQPEWITWAKEALPQALATLTPEEQRLVIAFYFDQQAVEDLAETLELSPERVRTLIEGSLRTLRQRLAAEQGR